MARQIAIACVLLCALGSCHAFEHRANPIRKVVTMLQDMEKSVKEEGEKEKKAYEEFACYCKTGVGTLEASISSSEAKIEALGSKIKEQSEKKDATEAALKEHTASRAEAKDQMAKATALRDQEAKVEEEKTTQACQPSWTLHSKLLHCGCVSYVLQSMWRALCGAVYAV